MAEAASQRNMMNDEASVARAIRAKLMAAFAPVALDVVDESALHAGHSGARREGESHFRVRIVSPAFAGLSRLDRQRRVYDVLREELTGRVHALSLAALTPEETNQ
jgi:BolA family transcriptional regulator, general stress-responsive regulator